MSQPDLEFFTQRAIVSKIEATENLDAAPSTSVDGQLLMNSTADTQFDKKTRNVDSAFFNSKSFAVANKAAYVEGDFELFAPATPGQVATGLPTCDPLLQCAGMAAVKNAGAKTTIYNPISIAIPSATTYFWHAEKLIKITGGRNNISSIKMEIGSIFTGKVHIQGNYSNVTDQAMPTVTTYNNIPVVCSWDVSEAYISFNGGGELYIWAKSLEAIFGNKLASKEYTGTKKARISDKDTTFNLRMSKTAAADFDPWNVRDNNQLFTARMRTYETGNYGKMSGLFSELSVRGQLDQIKPANIDDDYGWDLSGMCKASSAGNDECLIKFGDDTSLITTAYPAGVHGVTNIAQTFSGRALVGAQAWSVIAGALPTGITLNAVTGLYSGTSSAGTFTWTVQVIDSSTPIPQVLTKTYTGVVLS
jgi:hypothetical protein